METTITYLSDFDHETIFHMSGAVRLRYKVIAKLVADGWDQSVIEDVIAWSGNSARYSSQRESILFREFVHDEMVVIEILKSGIQKIHSFTVLIVPNGRG